MDANIKRRKQIIRDFMRTQYTDGKLIDLLRMARAGELRFMSCCCFIGIPTATAEHLAIAAHDRCDRGHYKAAELLPNAIKAENAFLHLNLYPRSDALGTDGDEVRRRRLIPIILAEIKRRERLRAHDNIFASASSGDTDASRADAVSSLT